MATTANQTRLEAGRRIFTRILVGVDGSQQALEAARQAALLQDVDGQLTLLAAWDIAPVIGGTGSSIPYYLDEEFQQTAAEKGLLAATEYVAPYTAATTKLVRGTPVATLLGEIERDEDTLIAVGSSGTGRLLGIVEGAVATELIHRAPPRCSLCARRRTASRGESSSASTARSIRPPPTQWPATWPSASMRSYTRSSRRAARASTSGSSQ